MQDVWLFMFLLAYVFYCSSLHLIANKTSTAKGWLAWIPVAYLYLQCKIAKKPGWWLLLLFVPVVSIVVSLVVWMEIARARNKAGWLGILMILPVANLVVIGYLAFSD